MITLEINDAGVTAAFDRLAAGLEDMTPAMQEIAEFLVASTKDRFGQGVSPEGQTWAPKSETTKEAYRRRKDRVDDRPLFGPSGMLSSQIFAIPGPRSVEWGSPMIYAGAMHFGAAKGAFGSTARGTPIPWGSIPARPFLGVSQSDGEGIVEIASEYLSEL